MVHIWLSYSTLYRQKYKSHYFHPIPSQPHPHPYTPYLLPLHTHGQCLNDICNISHNFIHYGALPVYPRFNDLGIISRFDWQQKGNKKVHNIFLVHMFIGQSGLNLVFELHIWTRSYTWCCSWFYLLKWLISGFCIFKKAF